MRICTVRVSRKNELLAQVNSITIEIPGDPTPKGRPRFNRVTGSVYTPKKTESAEKFASLCARQVMKKSSRGVISGPCMLQLWVFCRVPKSWPKKKREIALKNEIRPATKTGDLDNFIKLVSDAFNGIVYDDDSQIVTLSAAKFYAEEPAIIAEITPLKSTFAEQRVAA